MECQTITLDFLRDDGKRETATLFDGTLNQARSFADSIFRKAPGLYVEVEIRSDSGYSELTSHLYASRVEDLQTDLKE